MAHGFQLGDLVGSIARAYGDYYSGVVATAGITSLQDNNLIDPDNYWNNRYLVFTSGFQQGLERRVTSYTQASGVSFAPAIGVAPSYGDTYEMKPLRDKQIIDTIADAQNRMAGKWMVIKTTDAYTLDVGTQVYALPADMIDIISIDVYTALVLNGVGEWRHLRTWEVRGAPGSYTLVMRGWEFIPNLPHISYKLLITYLANTNDLVLRSDDPGLDAGHHDEWYDFIKEYSLHLLHEAAMAGNITGEQARGHLSLSQSHLLKAQDSERRASPKVYSRRITTTPRPRMLG